MTAATIDSNLDQLQRSLAAVVADLEQLADVHLEAAGEVLGHVHPPVRTHHLADSVHAEADALGFVVLAGGPQAPYGPYVDARVHFLHAAAEQAADDVVDVYTDHVERLLDDI